MNSNNQGGSCGRSKSKEEIIKQIASGNYGNNILLSWKTQIRHIIIEKMTVVLINLNELYPYVKEYPEDTFEENVKRLSNAILSFDCPPFTIQRLAEILIESSPNNIYQIKNTNVFIRRLVKMVSVTSTIGA